MAELTFTLDAQGPAESLIARIAGRTEVLQGPSFTLGGAAAGLSSVTVTQVDFGRHSVTGYPFGDGLATLEVLDQPVAGAGALLDPDGDGRLETLAFRLNQPGSVAAVGVQAFDGDRLLLQGWERVDLALAAKTAPGAVEIAGAARGALVTGPAADTLHVATAGYGSGEFTILTQGGNDDVRIDAGFGYSGRASVALGGGNDSLVVTRAPGDGGYRILAAGAEAAGASAGADMAVAGSGGASASSLIYPPYAPAAARLTVVADGGEGADHLSLSNAVAAVGGGPGNDVITLGPGTVAEVRPGAGADTVVIGYGAETTVTIAAGETGSDPATADTIRFNGGLPSDTVLRLGGYSPGAAAELVRDAPAGGGFQPVVAARLVVRDGADTDMVNLIGVNTGPLDALTVVFV